MNINLGFLIWGLVSLGLGGLGGYVIYAAIRSTRECDDSDKWPFTVGKITEFQLKADRDDEGRKIRYIPQISYVYQVEGKILDGKRIRFGRAPSFRSKYDAEEFLESYPVGAEINVFYDPSNPKKSVLIKEFLDYKKDIWTGVILILVMMGMFCALQIFITL